MCGRYYRKTDKQAIAEAFHVAQVDDFPLPPWDYNVAPTTMQPIIRASRDTGQRELVQRLFASSLSLSQKYVLPKQLWSLPPSPACGCSDDWPSAISVLAPTIVRRQREGTRMFFTLS